MKKGITSVVAALFLASCASAHGGTRDDSGIRVMTWNIAAGHGNLSAIADEIRKAAPDIVALQEVDVHWSERSSFADQADSLSKLLHMQSRFAPIYSIADSSNAKPPREFGVAVLSRYPIVGFTNHRITRLTTQQVNPAPAPAPGFLEAVIDVKGTRIRVFDTHLDYRGDPSVRRTQVAETVQIVGSSTIPTLLFGDLNAPPPAAELQPLFTILRDAAAMSGANAPTYPAESPTKRIDYVLVSDRFRPGAARVVETVASDHRPVVVDLFITER